MSDAEVVERLRHICTDADPTKLYRSFTKIGQGCVCPCVPYESWRADGLDAVLLVVSTRRIKWAQIFRLQLSR